jgi:hypothetical protein
VALLLALGLAACSQPSSKPEVTQDPEPGKNGRFFRPLVEEMVRAAMNKPEGDITLAEAEAVNGIEAWRRLATEPAPTTQIKDISGLENFKSLETLSCISMRSQTYRLLRGLRNSPAYRWAEIQ